MAAGLILLPSAHSVAVTLDRLETAARAKGLEIFARIDHAAGATAAGLSLRPTAVLIFGHARGGTPLMQAAQSIGLDLPLKALAYEDAAGQVFLSYEDMGQIARRHGLSAEAAPTVETLRAALSALAHAAIAAE